MALDHPSEKNSSVTAGQAQRDQVRIDLAAAHRLAVRHGLDQGIYNHLTVAVPGTDDRFLLLPFGLHWAEAKASDFIELGYDGQIRRGEGRIQRSAYCIHAPIHRRAPQHAVVFHTHMPFASALARLRDPRLLPLGQSEAILLDDIAYDRDYSGLARDPAEGERLADILGPDKTILILAGHGVVVTGRSIAEAYDRLWSLERACQLQLYAQWTGQPLQLLTDAQLDLVRTQYAKPLIQDGDPGAGTGFALHFAALKRLLDRSEPDYRE
jgi:ribulose-5-phosphate 4-epimerase/fuculose-1-phosphate aldolase